jgi:flagellum-specific ATP synthase
VKVLLNVIGLTIEVRGIKAFVGELCIIYNEKNTPVNCSGGFRDEFNSYAF